MSNIPHGWAAHPSAPGWIYELANPANMAQAPVAAPPPPPTPQHAQQPQQGYAPPQGQAAVGDGSTRPDWMDDVDADYVAANDRGGHKYLDFDECKKPGDASVLRVRLLPPRISDLRTPYIKTAQHRIYADLCPWETKGKVAFVTSLDSTGGPGNCPITAILDEMSMSREEETKKVAKAFKARSSYVWQVANMADLQSHWVQRKDSVGNVVMENGQPVWDLLPALLRLGQQSHMQIAALLKDSDWGPQMTHPTAGYTIKIVKTRTGTGDMDIEYTVHPVQREPIPNEYLGIINNLIDLRTVPYFREREVMEQIAANMRARFLRNAPPAQGGYPPPQGAGYGHAPQGFTPPHQPAQPAPHGYPPAPPAGPPQGYPQQPPQAPYPPAPPSAPPQTYGTPPAPPQGYPQPAMPPQMPPGVPPAPPPAPPGYPPQHGGPPAPPTRPLPPPSAPGGYPPATPQGHAPPGYGQPPMPPQMPPGVPPHHAPAMSPEQFEQQLAGQGRNPFTDDIPF